MSHSVENRSLDGSDREYMWAGDRMLLFKTMLMSRQADIRENILFRQGQGQFHLPSAGHEAMAAISPLIEVDDWTYCYYRDRALLLGMGVPLYNIALGFFGKADSSSAGRQMASHFSYKPLNIVSCATPTALQCLPAVGTAWSLQKDKSTNVVFCCIGDASTRQGEFFESIAFALQENLPIIFLVEDNGYGISTPTGKMTPLGLNMMNEKFIHVMNGRDPIMLNKEMKTLIDKVRNGSGPAIAWIKLDRLMSHTSSDSQEKYRSQDELRRAKENDPIEALRKSLILDGMHEEYLLKLEEEIKTEVKEIYSIAKISNDPNPTQINEHIFSNEQSAKRINFTEITNQSELSMSDAFNLTLKKIMAENTKAILFGEDIEDPKGGVFGLTKGLSTAFPKRVHNSPLAEATIAGLASGLAVNGYLPIFELQFIDFIGTAFNQIVNQIATLRWRSAGEYKCPLIIYAPCGSYISGGGPWHSQTNESWLAHAPGLKVYMPSSANEASSMLYHAAHGDDPVLMLLPKNQFQKKSALTFDCSLYPEKAIIKKSGEHLTMVAWGNCVELALNASKLLESKEVKADVIDLNTIVPCDWVTIQRSVQKTGRLLVIQEDNRTCSFGQAIISEISSNLDVWGNMYTAPRLLSRSDVHIGFNSILETAVLPTVNDIVYEAEKLVGL